MHASSRPAVGHRAGLMAACLLVAACSGPTVFLRRPEQSQTWPGQPDKARIALVLAYHGGQDVERHPGFWASLAGFFAGSDEPEFVTPCGLAVAGPDTLWIADPGCGAVHRLDLVSGEHLVVRGSAAEPMVTPVGVAVGGDGQVFVSDSSRARILVLDAGGQVQRAFGSTAELGRPTGICWDPRGQRLLVIDTTGCRLLAFDALGHCLQQVGERGDLPGQFNYPTNLALAADGRVFVVDSLNFRVQILDAALRPVSTFGSVGRGPGSFANPKGVAIDSDGQVYVVDSMFDNVQIFAASGQLLLPFGSHGSQLGELQLPSGICIDGEDRIFVADGGNARVQIFRYLRRRT